MVSQKSIIWAEKVHRERNRIQLFRHMQARMASSLNDPRLSAIKSAPPENARLAGALVAGMCGGVLNATAWAVGWYELDSTSQQLGQREQKEEKSSHARCRAEV